MKQWSHRFFSSTRGQIIQLLSAEPQSVADLADALHLTPNAIRAGLVALERDGLVRVTGKRAAVRKPETLYGLTEDAEQLFPRAYDLLFNTLLRVLQAHLPAREVDALLRRTGTELARLHPPKGATVLDRAREAVVLLQGMGGLPRLREDQHELAIEGDRCPLSSLVRAHPDVCRLAEAMLSELLGVRVSEECRRNGAPSCRFVFATTDA